ncbi:MAG: hypothetical protein JNJ57_08685, partial [Saprospiraceae bacterium]|nr:hypothetical protein [Saprospiraceae bacterium]
LIRGVCYGYPGETPMYKFGWRGEHVDTLEYVYFEKNSNGENTGKILVSKYPPDADIRQKVKRLNAVPNEYKTIEGYDWFTGAGYE